MGLKDKYESYFKIGTAVNIRTIKTHEELLRQHFNNITFENEMKYSSVCRAPGEYNFTAADRIYEFARENNMTVHGHCLVWHNQTPGFIFENTTPDDLKETLREHIRRLGNRYGELAESWDVVNEGIEDKTDLFYRDTKWHRMYGDNYMDGMFMIAHEVLPGKKLFYNDYNESIPEKREKIYQLVKGMKERGVPIDGIGLQCHHNIYEPGVDGLKKAIERYAELGLRLRITEMDISVFRFEDRTHLAEAPKELMERQAELYEQYFELFREYHELIDAVTLWGPADDTTWLDNFPEPGRKNWPLLFDVNQEPKEAYHRVMNF